MMFIYFRPCMQIFWELIFDWCFRFFKYRNPSEFIQHHFTVSQLLISLMRNLMFFNFDHFNVAWFFSQEAFWSFSFISTILKLQNCMWLHFHSLSWALNEPFQSRNPCPSVMKNNPWSFPFYVFSLPSIWDSY